MDILTLQEKNKRLIRKFIGSYWESERFIVPFEAKGQHNPGRGKEPYFVHATNERRIRRLRDAINSLKSGRYRGRSIARPSWISACFTTKNIGKPYTGKPYARFDEGALRKKRTLEHVVAACGEASIKEPKNLPNQCSTLPLFFYIFFIPSSSQRSRLPWKGKNFRTTINTVLT